MHFISEQQLQLKKRHHKELQKLDKQVWNIIGCGYKESSRDNIKSQYNNYKRFCSYFFLTKFPADSWQLCRFAQYLANKGKSPGTVANNLSTVRTLKVLKGYATPDLYDIAIRLQLKGLQNLSEHVKKQAEVMTPQMLLEISKIVNYSKINEVVCFVALLTRFFLLLRKSNLVPVAMMGKTRFNGEKQY